MGICVGVGLLFVMAWREQEADETEAGETETGTKDE
jgi:hypothetical protein